MSTTLSQYDQVIATCRDLFLKKTTDYGTSWRVYRPVSVADQIYIKAKRIRTIQETKKQRIGDSIKSEFMGILNYAVIGLVQDMLAPDAPEDLPVDQVHSLYDAAITQARNLMQYKNHDYGEAWRDLSQESYVDLILSKLLRIRQILSNQGRTLVSEGIDANYLDILNYAAFALIMIEEARHVA